MRRKGQVTWEVAAAVIGAIGGGLALMGYLAGPARWTGDLEARVKNVEAASTRIETKVDQILLQRGTK